MTQTRPLKSRLNWIFSIAIFMLCIVFVITMVRSNLSRNVESRALDEIHSTVNMQASAFMDHRDSHYQALNLVEDMLENGRHFTSEKIRPTLRSIVRTFELCTLAFADTNGDVIDYEGNRMGNLGTRAYFEEIMNGNATQYCEYLASTQATSDPRIIFSIPSYDENGELSGVLFCSKEISVMENSIFEHSALFDTSTAIFICDASGALIAANESAHSYFGIDSDEAFNVFEWNPRFAELRQNDGDANCLDIGGLRYFAACASVETSGWYLYCVVDEQSAAITYRANQSRITSTVISITIVFALALIYILVLTMLYNRRRNREALTIRHNYDNYRKILQETNCAVIEYDIGREKLTPIQAKLDRWDLNFLDSVKAYAAYKRLHQEFNFEEYERVMRLAVETGETYPFESFLTMADGKYYWLRMAIIPIADEDGIATRLLFAIFNVSEVHQKDNAGSLLETYAMIPGGVYRCNLNAPMHIEYISDGLCDMIGYTHDEVDAIIGPERMYAQLICEADRGSYIRFIEESAQQGGTQTCEYRMMHKDGSLLSVSDTMEARRSSLGIMYGYSVITDLGKYKEMQQKLEQELEETRRQLEDARIKNANSQMQPHFLYNALASIREIVLEDPQYASDLIYDFTTHLRACIRSMSGDTLIPFAQELANIKAYVNIEKMRFGDRLQIEYDCPQTDFDIVPLGIQPLVENAIRHGIYEKGAKGGKVSVCTAREGNNFLVCVTDNGVGFDFEKTMKEVREGTRDSSGLYNLLYRFERLMNAKVTVESRIGCGTKITVTIPTTGGGDDL